MGQVRYRVVFFNGVEEEEAYKTQGETFAHPQQAWRALESRMDANREYLRACGYRVRRVAVVTDEAAFDRVDQMVRESRMSGSKSTMLRRMLSWIRPR